VVAIVAVGVCLPGNVDAIARPHDPAELGAPVGALVTADVAARFPDLPLDRGASLALLRPLRWVVEQERAGRIPRAPAGHAETRSRVFSSLAFAPVAPSGRRCPPAADPDRLPLEVGDVVQIRAPAGTVVTIEDTGRHLTAPFAVGASGSTDLQVTAGPMTVAVRAAPTSAVVRVGRCP
jgi:hypothetical protein